MPDSPIPEDTMGVILMVHQQVINLAVDMKATCGYDLQTKVYKVNSKKEHTSKDGERGTVIGSLYYGADKEKNILLSLYGCKEILYVVKWDRLDKPCFVGDTYITDQRPEDYVEPDPYEF